MWENVVLTGNLVSFGYVWWMLPWGDDHLFIIWVHAKLVLTCGFLQGWKSRAAQKTVIRPSLCTLRIILTQGIPSGKGENLHHFTWKMVVFLSHCESGLCPSAL
jgi:hypothetical protein